MNHLTMQLTATPGCDLIEMFTEAAAVCRTLKLKSVEVSRDEETIYEVEPERARLLGNGWSTGWTRGGPDGWKRLGA